MLDLTELFVFVDDVSIHLAHEIQSLRNDYGFLTSKANP